MIGKVFAIARRVGWAPHDLPLRRDPAWRFLPWVMALMVYVAALSGIGLILLHATLRAAERSLAATLTLQVPAEASNARLETILALLKQTKGVESVHALEPAETARLLEPWLGPTVSLDELPVPRLIDLRVDPGAPPDLPALRRQLASVLPEARLDDHRPGLDGMRAAARWSEIVLAVAIAAALLLIAASAVFAARTGLLVQRSAVEVLHLFGAADADIAARFATRYLGLGLLGGAVGGVAAVLTILALGGVGPLVQLAAPLSATEAGGSIADWQSWAVLGVAILAAGLIAMASARLTVLRWLARLP
jgi:cell division transport system permease protein